MSRTRTLITALVAALAAAGFAAPAGASTQRLAGVLEDGRLVTFTSQAPTGLSTPVRVQGLQAREQLLALAAHRGRLFGLGSAARLYGIDRRSGRATPLAGGRPIAQGLRGRSFSLGITPDGLRARILSDVGQDVLVDLASGAETPGPGVRTEQGAQLRPAATIAEDGRLVGIDLLRQVVVRETQPGSGTVTTQPLRREREAPLGVTAPLAFAQGAGGRGYLVGALSDEGRVRQSRMLTVQSGGQVLTRGGGFFLRRVVTVAALEEVAEDATAPRARVVVPRRVSVRELDRTGLLRVSVRSPEAAQVLTSLRVGERAATRRVGFSLATRDTPGVVRRQPFTVSDRDLRILRRAIGDRVRIVVSVNDFAGNGRSVVRYTRLVR